MKTVPYITQCRINIVSIFPKDDAGPQNDADGWGRRSGRFITTWRFRSTRSPRNLSVDTAADAEPPE